MVWRMTVEAPNVVASVHRRREVALLMGFSVTTQAAFIDFLLRQRFETDDLADIASAVDVLGSGTMTGFAAVFIMQCGLKVRSSLKVFLIEVFVTSFTGIGADIFRRRTSSGRVACLLSRSWDRFNGCEKEQRYDRRPNEAFGPTTDIHDDSFFRFQMAGE